MKKSFICMLLISLFLASGLCFAGCGEAPLDPSTYTRVVILSGQSNMQGSARIDLLSEQSVGKERYARLCTPFENVKIVSELGNPETAVPEFVNVQLGVGAFYKDGFGPEIGLAEELCKCEGDTYFIKCAYSGTSLEDYWRSPSMTEDGKGSPMWQSMTSFVDSNLKKLEDAGLNPKIVAFCWMQGEADASNEAPSLNYESNLDKFVGDLRAKYDEKSIYTHLQFIDAKINASPIWPFNENVNRAKENFAKKSSSNHLIDTLKRGLIEPWHDGLFTDREPSAGLTEIDPLHYDTTSQLKLGNLFAEKIRALARI